MHTVDLKTNEDRSARPSPQAQDDQLLTTAEAASLLGLSPAWLERDRSRSKPLLPFVRVAYRAVRYRVGDLRAHVVGRTVRGL